MPSIEDRIAALEVKVKALCALIELPVTAPAKKKRACQLPADWTPEQGEVEKLMASHPNVDIENETDCFRDYWASKGEARADWAATYRNWIRRAATFAKAPVTRLQSRPAGRAAAIGENNRARVDSALDKLHALQQGTGARSSKG